MSSELVYESSVYDRILPKNKISAICNLILGTFQALYSIQANVGPNSCNPTSRLAAAIGPPPNVFRNKETWVQFLSGREMAGVGADVPRTRVWHSGCHIVFER